MCACARVCDATKGGRWGAWVSESEMEACELLSCSSFFERCCQEARDGVEVVARACVCWGRGGGGGGAPLARSVDRNSERVGILVLTPPPLPPAPLIPLLYSCPPPPSCPAPKLKPYVSSTTPLPTVVQEQIE